MQIINAEEEKAKKSAVVKTCILEKAKDSDEVVLEVDERIVKHLKPHQAEGIRFIFDSTFESVSKAGAKGGGCILAHCMGLGKTLQVSLLLRSYFAISCLHSPFDSAFLVLQERVVQTLIAEMSVSDPLKRNIYIFIAVSYLFTVEKCFSLSQCHLNWQLYQYFKE